MLHNSKLICPLYSCNSTQGNEIWEQNLITDFSTLLANGIFLFQGTANDGNEIIIKLVCIK
jgi:hypothetical protein